MTVEVVGDHSGKPRIERIVKQRNLDAHSQGTGGKKGT